MAYVRGDRADDPITIDDSRPNVGPRLIRMSNTGTVPKSAESRRKEVVNLVDDEDNPVIESTGDFDLTDDDIQELRPEDVPAASLNPPKRKINRQSINGPRSSISSHRHTNPEVRIASRPPSAKPAGRHGTSTPAGDDGEARHRSTPQQDAISHSFSHGRVTPLPRSSADKDPNSRHRFTPRRSAISRSSSHDRNAKPSTTIANTVSPAMHVKRGPRKRTPTTLSAPEVPGMTADAMTSGDLRQSSDGKSSVESRRGNMLSTVSSSVQTMHNAQAPKVTTAVTIGIPSDEPQIQKLSSPLLSAHRNGKTDGDTRQNHNTMELESTGEGSSRPAFGSRAESKREQTISRRVDSDATRTSMQGQHDSESRSASNKPTPLQPGLQSRIPVKQKQRAVKSAEKRKSVEKRRPVERAPQLSAKNHESSSNSTPPAQSRADIERPLLEPTSIGQDEESIPVVESAEQNTTSPRDTSRNRQGTTCATREPISPIDAERIDMGAQASSISPLAVSLEKSSIDGPAIAPGLSTSAHSCDAVASDALENHVVPILGSSREHVDDTAIQGSPSDLIAAALVDIEDARYRVEACLQRHLDERFEDHAYLVKNIMWRQRTCYERDIRPRTNLADLHSNSSAQDKFEQSQSPFGHMQDIQSIPEKSHAPNSKEITQEMFTKAPSKGSTLKTTRSVPISKHVPEELQIPSFKEYVRLKNNILADNESKILTLPYLGEDEPEERQNVLRNELPTRYEILHDRNALLDFRHEQCQFYYDTTEAFLKDIGVSWDTMIYWLLSSATDLQQINKKSENWGDFEEVLKNRAPYNTESFARDEHMMRVAGLTEATLFKPGSRHWRTLLIKLQKPSAEHLRLVALASAALMLHCNLSTWYMIKQCETMQNHVLAKLKRPKEAQDPTFRDMLCRICHEHDCVFHGEIRQSPNGDSEDESHRSPSPHSSSPNSSSRDDSEEDDSEPEIAHYDSNDSDVEKIINYKFPVNSTRPDDDAWLDTGVPKYPLPPAGAFKAKWWENHTGTSNWELRKPFVPCNHLGSCVDAKCRCYRENITCEKTCMCPESCNRRFPGCTCAQSSNKRPCAAKSGCLCRKFDRECDADLCGTCGAHEVLDPIRRHDEKYLTDRCTNVPIQRGVPKKTLLGKSEVHGFGLYAGEDICKGEHIGEYVGEIISNDESQRREIIYHYEKNMYLFKLNHEQEVDATYMGNKLRFINNASKSLTNCSCHLALCNTVFRVALIADSDIKAGSELFFDYNYPEEMTKSFKQPKGKVVAIKQLVKDARKAGTNRASSHASSNNDDRRSSIARPSNAAATAIARAAKKAKREAMLAQQGSGAMPPKKASKSSRSARKSAGTSGFLAIPRESSARGRSRQAGDATSRDESTASASATRSNRGRSARRQKSATPVVEETDNEDEDYDAVSGAEESSREPQAGTGGQGATSQRPASRLRDRAVKSAQVMAVKEVKKKKSSLKSVAGRKRKRRVVVNSDDEV